MYLKTDKPKQEQDKSFYDQLQHVIELKQTFEIPR